jgi:Na+-translocating ferredoxin:NAD+ oxidoreductase subunit G
MLRRSIGFNGLLLGLFALVTAGVVATTQQMTKGRIAEAELRAAQAALYEIIPRDVHDNDLLLDTQPIPDNFENLLGLSGRDVDKQLIHVARKDGEAFAVIVPTVAPDGYSGPIEMLLGIDGDGTILGVRVTRHNETPGLGDRIEVKKSNWILSFDGKILDSSLSDQSGFDQLTGATITRKAVTRQVERALAFFEKTKPLELAKER